MSERIDFGSKSLLSSFSYYVLLLSCLDFPNLNVYIILVLIVGLGFLLSWILNDIILKRPHLTLPQVYALLLYKIHKLSQAVRNETSSEKKSHEFHQLEDAASRLVKRIDFDISTLSNNLAAAQTVSVLRNLRSYLLKFAHVFAWVTGESRLISASP